MHPLIKKITVSKHAIERVSERFRTEDIDKILATATITRVRNTGFDIEISTRNLKGICKFNDDGSIVLATFIYLDESVGYVPPPSTRRSSETIQQWLNRTSNYSNIKQFDAENYHRNVIPDFRSSIGIDDNIQVSNNGHLFKF